MAGRGEGPLQPDGSAAQGRYRRLVIVPARSARVVPTACRSPDPQEIQLRVLRAGLCGTDVQIAAGHRPDAASVLGHEGLAMPGGDGRAVICNPVHAADQDQILGHSYDGLFQDRVNLRRSHHGGPELFAAAPELPADLAPLVEPLACVLYSYELLTLESPLRSLLVIGAGATALMHALVGRAHGIEVHLAHRRAARLAWLLDRDLVPGVSMHVAGRDLGVRLRASRSEAAVDAAVLCVPRQAAAEALAQALDCVRDGGSIDLFGGFSAGDTHPLLPGLDLGDVRRANVRGSPRPGRRRLAETRMGSTVWVTGHRGTSCAHLAEAQNRLLQSADLFARLVDEVVSLELLASILTGLARTGTAPGERCKTVVDLTLAAGERRPVDLGRLVADVS